MKQSEEAAVPPSGLRPWRPENENLTEVSEIFSSFGTAADECQTKHANSNANDARHSANLSTVDGSPHAQDGIQKGRGSKKPSPTHNRHELDEWHGQKHRHQQSDQSHGPSSNSALDAKMSYRNARPSGEINQMNLETGQQHSSATVSDAAVQSIQSAGDRWASNSSGVEMKFQGNKRRDEEDHYENQRDAKHHDVKMEDRRKSQPRRRPIRRAVLVACQYEWHWDERRHLRGCFNDVALLYDVLLNELGFEENDEIYILSDGVTGLEHRVQHRPATASSIMAHLKLLVKDAKPGDSMWFSFSGHGRQVEDKNHDEGDNLDEALVASDFHNVLDDHICEILTSVPPGARVTGVIDACNSGTGMLHSMVLSFLFLPLLFYHSKFVDTS